METMLNGNRLEYVQKRCRFFEGLFALLIKSARNVFGLRILGCASRAVGTLFNLLGLRSWGQTSKPKLRPVVVS